MLLARVDNADSAVSFKGRRRRARNSVVAIAGLVVSTLVSADALRVGDTLVDGVDVSGVTYRSGELIVELAPGSNTLVSAPFVPDFEEPEGCGSATISCAGDFGFLQDRVLSDSIELPSGVTYASELVLSQAVNPNLLVLEFRSSANVLPDIQVNLSLEPGGAALGPGCSFTISGFVGSRIYLAHDGSSADLKNRYCDIDRGERYFLNLSLASGSGSVASVRRTIKLAGI